MSKYNRFQWFLLMPVSVSLTVRMFEGCETYTNKETIKLPTELYYILLLLFSFLRRTSRKARKKRPQWRTWYAHLCLFGSEITPVSTQKCLRDNSGGHQQIILHLQSCKSTLYISLEAKIGYRGVICGLVVSTFTWTVWALVTIETLDIHSKAERQCSATAEAEVMPKLAEDDDTESLRHSSPPDMICISSASVYVLTQRLLSSTNSATSCRILPHSLPLSSRNLARPVAPRAPRKKDMSCSDAPADGKCRHKLNSQRERVLGRGAASTRRSPDSESDNGLWSVSVFCSESAAQQSTANALEQNYWPCKKRNPSPGFE